MIINNTEEYKNIQYTCGYKYQLENTCNTFLSFRAPSDISTEYIRFIGFTLTIKKGYAWDGPSGPTIDTKNFMRGSLIHDALYQLMREKHLDHDRYRELADKELYRIVLEDGMNKLRAWNVYQAVRLFGDPSADPRYNKQIITAP